MSVIKKLLRSNKQQIRTNPPREIAARQLPAPLGDVSGQPFSQQWKPTSRKGAVPGVVPNVCILLPHPYHHTSAARAANNAREKKALGASSPANPALTIPVPLSHIRGWISSPSAISYRYFAKGSTTTKGSTTAAAACRFPDICRHIGCDISCRNGGRAFSLREPLKALQNKSVAMR